jgi:hypothetical protein
MAGSTANTMMNVKTDKPVIQVNLTQNFNMKISEAEKKEWQTETVKVINIALKRYLTQ